MTMRHDRGIAPAVQSLDYPRLLSGRLARLRSELPYWSGGATDPLYKATENAAYRENLILEFINERLLALDPANARGGDLDLLGALLGRARMAGEADAFYSRRLLAAPSEDLNPSDINYYKAELLAAARDAGADDPLRFIESAVVQLPQRTGDNILISALSSDTANGIPSAATGNAIAAHFADSDRHLMGYVINYSAPFPESYTIQAAITYDSNDNEDDVRAEVEAAALAFVRAERDFGKTVLYVSAIAAALHTPMVLGVAVTTPAGDLTRIRDNLANIWKSYYYCPAVIGPSGINLSYSGVST